MFAVAPSVKERWRLWLGRLEVEKDEMGERMSFLPPDRPLELPDAVEPARVGTASDGFEGVIFNPATLAAGVVPSASPVGVTAPLLRPLLLPWTDEAIVVVATDEGVFLALPLPWWPPTRPHPRGETIPAFRPGACLRSLCLRKTLAWIASTSSNAPPAPPPPPVVEGAPTTWWWWWWAW